MPQSNRRGGGKGKGGGKKADSSDVQDDSQSQEEIKCQKMAAQLKKEMALPCDEWELAGALEKFDMDSNTAVEFVLNMNPSQREALRESTFAGQANKTQKKKKEENRSQPRDTYTEPYSSPPSRHTGPSGSRSGEKGKSSGYPANHAAGGRGGGKNTNAGVKGGGRGGVAPAAAPITSTPTSASIVSVQAPPQIASGPPPTQADTWGKVNLAQKIAQSQEAEQREREAQARAQAQAVQAQAQAAAQAAAQAQAAVRQQQAAQAGGRGSNKGFVAAEAGFSKSEIQGSPTQPPAPTHTKGRGRGAKKGAQQASGAGFNGNSVGRGQPANTNAPPSNAGAMNSFDASSVVPETTSPASFSVKDLFNAQESAQAQVQGTFPKPPGQAGGFELSSVAAAVPYSTGGSGAAKVRLPPQSMAQADDSNNWHFGDFGGGGGGMQFGSQDPTGMVQGSRMPHMAQQQQSQQEPSSQSGAAQEGFAAPSSLPEAQAESAQYGMDSNMQSNDPSMQGEVGVEEQDAQAQMYSPQMGQFGYPFMMNAAMGGPAYAYDPSSDVYGYNPPGLYPSAAGGAATAVSSFPNRDGKSYESGKNGQNNGSAAPAGQRSGNAASMAYPNMPMQPYMNMSPYAMGGFMPGGYMGGYQGYPVPGPRGAQFKGGADGAVYGYQQYGSYDDYGQKMAYSQQMYGVMPPQAMQQQQPATSQSGGEPASSSAPSTNGSNARSAPATSSAGGKGGATQGAANYATPGYMPAGTAARMPFIAPMQAGAALPGMSPQQMGHPGAMGSAAMPSYASRPPAQFPQQGAGWTSQQ